jgi:eukaryotic-like serine/threonine-protein kinase
MPSIEPREITESFRLERVLKSSRSSIVFRANDPRSGGTVAIKLIPPGSPADVEASQQRFLAAMAVLTRAAPPTFPVLFDHGFSPDGSAFMVMELVEGERLDTLAGVAPARILGLVLEILDGLEVLARFGTAHGNLAPENVLACRANGVEHVRILGFGSVAFHGGVARTVGPASLEGPAQFAAPELLEADAAGHANWSADLYALAGSCAALLRAEVGPADAPDPKVTLPPEVRQRVHEPDALEAILEQSLRRDAATRPSSLDEVRRSLRRALSGIGTTETPGGPAQWSAASPDHGASATLLENPTLRMAAVAAAEISPEDVVESTAPAQATPDVPEEPVPEEVLPPPETASELEAALVAGKVEPSTLIEPLPAAEPLEETFGTVALAPGKLPQSALFAVDEGPNAMPEAVSEVAETGPMQVELADAAVVPLDGPVVVQTPEPEGAMEPPPAATAPELAVQPMTQGPAVEPGPQAASEAQGPAAAEPPREGTPAPPPATAKRRTGHHALVTGAVVVVVLGIAIAAIWFATQQPGTRPVAALPTAVPRKPSPPPQPAAPPPALTALQRAEAALALGDLPATRAALDAIAPADLGDLDPAEQERFKSLSADYATRRQQAVTKELQAALASGNLKSLGETVRGISREEAAAYSHVPDLAATLDDARRALNVQTALLKAQRQGDLGEVVQQAGVLLTLAPRNAQAADLREKAAASIERDADVAAAKGNFQAALTRLEAVHRSWPSRPGLADRLDRLKADQAAEQKFTALMTQVEATAKDQKPEKGLELLRSLPADPRTDARARAARERLEKQLAQLDAAPPTVVLAPDIKLEYKKGESATITLRIQDDHAVKSAQLFARLEGGGEYVELPLRKGAGADYTAEVTAAFHKNQTLDFYAVASDYSGHNGRLGTAADPLKLKRKKNWLGF